MSSKAKTRKWRNTQRNTTTLDGHKGGPPKLSQPLWLNTLHDVLVQCSLAERTLSPASVGTTVPSVVERSQLRPPSLIADAPLKLWLKQLDSETLEALYNKSVAASAKAKLLGQRDETAYRVNRIREATHRELEYRRTKPPSAQSPALGSQADQPRAERLHRSVPKGRRQTCSQPVKG